MDRTTELIRKAHEGDQEARTRLVEENVGLVWCIVRRYSGRGTEAEGSLSDRKHQPVK